MDTLPRVKICCISSVEEAKQAVMHGAAALGFVSHMPSGPGIILDELIAEIVATVPPPIATFLLTSLQDAEAIAKQHAVCKTSTIQLVDHVKPEEIEKLRRLVPSVKLVQVIHVLGRESLEVAERAAQYVDALLLDSGNPNLRVKVLGGTGQVHDWQVSRQICERINKPVFLAGGLRWSNVVEAIATVKPFGLDLCSSVREDGKLCVEKLAKFMLAVGRANSLRT